jgi:TPR repeat protein
MVENLNELLKKVSEGDEAALTTLLNFFQTQALSAAEEEQCHFYFKKVMEDNHHIIYLRGLLYKYGYSVNKDLDMSFLLMREAASKGNSNAIFEVGHHFLQGMGVEQNYENAYQWLKMAAGSPYYNANAMYDLASLYEQGQGIPSDPEKATYWYEKAAEAGYLDARKKLMAKSSKRDEEFK